jgi:hypothetical protein
MTPGDVVARETPRLGTGLARRAVWPAVALAVYILGHALLVAVPPLRESAPAFCIFRVTTGVPCPTCGATRATLALASGEVGLAFRYNPLVSAAWLLLPAVLLGAVVFRPRWCSVSPAARRWTVRGALLVLAVAGLANWIYVVGNLRNVEHSSTDRALRTAAAAHPPRGAGADGL